MKAKLDNVNPHLDAARIRTLHLAQGAHIVEDEGTPLTPRANLNFVGAGVTATDDEENNATVVTIPGGEGGGVPPGYFGDGSDGDVTISADTTVEVMRHYNNLTIDAGVTLEWGHERPLFVKEILTINGTLNIPISAGVAGGDNSGGSGGAGGNDFGGAGGNATANGDNGDEPNYFAYRVLDDAPQAGANGGAGAVGSGGSGGAGQTGTLLAPRNYTFAVMTPIPDILEFISHNPPGGAGGGGGGATAGGGGGGGMGSFGDYIVVIAKHIVWGAAGAIESKGGDGGNGGNSDGDGGGGGGGAGGNGGIVILCYEEETGTRHVDVSGGSGGTGGTSVSADAGANGPDGYDGVVIDLGL